MSTLDIRIKQSELKVSHSKVPSSDKCSFLCSILYSKLEVVGGHKIKPVMSISVCLSRFVFRFWICVQMLSLKPYLMDNLFATIVSILQVILRCFIRLGLKRCNFSIVKLLLNLFNNIVNEKSPTTLLKTFSIKNDHIIFYCCILILLAKKTFNLGMIEYFYVLQ